MESEHNENTFSQPNKYDSDQVNLKKWEKLKGGIFLTAVTGMAMIFGFGTTIVMAKKKDPTMFAKGLMQSGGAKIPESGGSLALRALGYGTLCSITGVGLISFIFWKAVGAQNFQEFRQIMGEKLPKIPRNESAGRNEFDSFRDLINYILEEDKKKKCQ